MAEKLKPGYYWVKDRIGKQYTGGEWELAKIVEDNGYSYLYFFGSEIDVYEKSFDNLIISGPVSIPEPV